MSTDELLRAARELGGVVSQPSGMILARRPTKQDPKKFYIVALNFTSQEDLFALSTIIERWGLLGFDEQPTAPIINTLTPSPRPEEQIPRCPTHGTMMKPSKKPGSFFCPTKNWDGSYCKETISRG